MSLSSIISRYSTEAFPGIGTDKGTDHSYDVVYDAILPKYSSVRGLSVLEIGIWRGAFLQVLAEFFPDAHLTGLDISVDGLRYTPWNFDKIRVACANGTDPAVAAELKQTYDIIIEDASHLPGEQLATLEAFAPYVRPGGTYVIEDIDSHMGPDALAELERRLRAVGEKHGMRMEWLDRRNVKGRWDDIMAVFVRDVVV